MVKVRDQMSRNAKIPVKMPKPSDDEMNMKTMGELKLLIRVASIEVKKDDNTIYFFMDILI